MKTTFRGGIHPPGMKELSNECPLTRFVPKGEMVFPLSQHIGAPAKAVVRKGDRVLVGQPLAIAESVVSANVFSSCSGTVKAIEKRRTISGQMLDCVVIDNDGRFEKTGLFGGRHDITDITKEEIITRIRDAGIVGLGGAGFPTHVKLMPKEPDKIRYVIANGAECEPYLTCNDQLMRTYSRQIVEGLEIVLRLFDNAEGVIAIEDNKPEAIRIMRRAVRGKKRISVLTMVTKYPQGGERSLIQAVADVDYPVSMLPADLGCIVNNVGTLYAIQRAVIHLEPLFSHVMTLSGEAVKEPANYIVPDGTMVWEILEASGGLKEGVTLKKVLAGGPMMGVALPSLDVPVVKTTNGLTMLTEDAVDDVRRIMTSCLRCGRCNFACPQGLEPMLMAEASRLGNYERYEKKLHGLECISCGTCSYVCPAKRPLTQIFRQARAEIMEMKKAGGKQ